MTTQTHLIHSRRFLPLFVTQLLGAFNDNLFKNAMAFLIVFRLDGEGGLPAALMVTLAAGAFVLPYFLFSALAGQIADRTEKTALIRRLKALEVALSIVGGGALLLGDAWAMMAALFLLPMLGRQIGVELDVFDWIVQAPVAWLLELLVRIFAV